MADKTDRSKKVLTYHSEMVTKLGELFSTKSKEWDSICDQLEAMGDITPANREDNVKSMHDLCKCLKSNGTIVYGGYKTLRAVLRAQNVEAGQIIDTYTKLIHQENEGVENTCKSQAVFSEQNSEDRKRKQGPSGDRDPLDDSKLRKEKRKKVEEDRPYQFRKQMDNTHDARIIDVWTRARNAVGRIRGPQYTGTGIRVGTKYILTAYHVAKDITSKLIRKMILLRYLQT
ncbi:uncharacterized protein LOC110461907 isoform X2 [Mizuhopecten yessoensis]|uniref:uncharacterized protein LOC110461907 isoform X2 n=1 Tax=Mizuhopecten yessoensis TaxID=6573 RepID=UPI000B45D63F|nr:uncharacterized protein LOC110461907 isoform X2 [Mizuhopecten yessoensis]